MLAADFYRRQELGGNGVLELLTSQLTSGDGQNCPPKAN